MNLFASFESFGQEHNLYEGSDGVTCGAVLVGVSGGVDSMVLLHLLRRLFVKNRKQGKPFPCLYAAHLHHGIRGVQADRDLDKTQEYAKDNDIPFFSLRKDIVKFSRENHMGLEEAGRIVRYDFFSQIQKQLKERHNTVCLAVGHHKDDQAETILQHLFRGSGIDGLCGMRPKSGELIRPLLSFSKEDIYAYAKEQGVFFSEDETNQENEYSRNRWRNQIIPAIRDSMGIEPAESLWRTSVLLSEDRDFLFSQAKEIGDRQIKEDERGSFYIDRKSFFSLHPAMASRLVRILFEKIFFDIQNLEEKHVRSILHMVCRGRNEAKICLPGKKMAFLRGGRLFMGAAESFLEKERIFWPGFRGAFLLGDSPDICMSLLELEEKDGRFCGILSSSFSIGVFRVENPERLVYNNTIWYCDRFALRDVVLRCPKSGDMFSVAGTGVKKELRRHFTDWKIPPVFRDRILLAAKGNEVLWVPGAAHSYGFVDGISRQRHIDSRAVLKEQMYYKIQITENAGG